MPSRLSATKIRAKMQQNCISPSSMVTRTGLSASTIDRVINGRATGYNDHTAQCFANALGCTVMEILDDEYVTPVINSAVSASVETAIVGAVAEAVTVVVDDVSPRTPTESVAQTVPDMTVHLPPALDVAKYVDHLQADHQREIAEMKAAHQEHLADIRREKNVWRMVALAACALIAVNMLFLLIFMLR